VGCVVVGTTDVVTFHVEDVPGTLLLLESCFKEVVEEDWVGVLDAG